MESRVPSVYDVDLALSEYNDRHDRRVRRHRIERLAGVVLAFLLLGVPWILGMALIVYWAIEGARS